MKYSLLLFLLLLLNPLSKSSADKGDKLSLAPCMPADVVKMRVEWYDAFFGNDVGYGSPQNFYLVEGRPIEWLGYAPTDQRHKESYGVEYGFGGVDMRYYGQSAIITFYNVEEELMGRIEVHHYPLTGQWILYFTKLIATTDSNGEHYGNHIYAYPGVAKISCMFWLSQKEFEYAMGWGE